MTTDQTPLKTGTEYSFGQPRSFESFTVDVDGSSFGSVRKTGTKQFEHGNYVGPCPNGSLTFEGKPVGERETLYFSVPQGTQAIQRA